ncbi:MAG: hypothetical protein ACK4PR_08105, partial [Gammaproteobacteria bacterium]
MENQLEQHNAIISSQEQTDQANINTPSIDVDILPILENDINTNLPTPLLNETTPLNGQAIYNQINQFASSINFRSFTQKLNEFIVPYIRIADREIVITQLERFVSYQLDCFNSRNQADD